MDREIRELIIQMAAENPTYGHIYGELLILGYEVSERTVSYLGPVFDLQYPRGRHGESRQSPPSLRMERCGVVSDGQWESARISPLRYSAKSLRVELRYGRIFRSLRLNDVGLFQVSLSKIMG